MSMYVHFVSVCTLCECALCVCVCESMCVCVKACVCVLSKWQQWLRHRVVSVPT